MKEVFWQIIEKFPIIGPFLNILILVILPAIVIFGLVRNIKQKNKTKIIVFSCLSTLCLSFLFYFFLSMYSFLKFNQTVNQKFHEEIEQIQYYTVNEIGPKNIVSVSNNFPIIKMNDGITIGGEKEKTFTFFNKPEYKITGFVFYIDGFEVPVKYNFNPGYMYEINFEKIQKEYTIKDVGVFYYKGESEQCEIWTDEMEDGINCLFVKY